MLWKEKNGTTLEVTYWSVRLYKALWIAAILLIAFALVGMVFFGYEFWRLDQLNWFEKTASVPVKLDNIEAAIKALGRCV